MNRLVASVMIGACCLSASAWAQEPASEGAERLAAVVESSHSEWLGSFEKISINGRMQVRLVSTDSPESGPRIIYDTKGAATRFKAEVDKNGVLNVVEPVDDKRRSVTEATIYCRGIRSLSVVAADVTADAGIAEPVMFDLEVAGGAALTAAVEVADLMAEVTGKSRIVLSGHARYFTLNVSTAKFDASELATVSSSINASHGAEVTLSVSERLEAVTSTAAVISYEGSPTVVRTRSSLFGGEISRKME